MEDPDHRLVFSGVDGRTDTTLPAWFARTHPDADPVSFAEALLGVDEEGWFPIRIRASEFERRVIDQWFAHGNAE